MMDGELYYTIVKGRRKMPGEEGHIKPEQIWHMVDYIVGRLRRDLSVSPKKRNPNLTPAPRFFSGEWRLFQLPRLPNKRKWYANRPGWSTEMSVNNLLHDIYYGGGGGSRNIRIR
jgi:hypothetical protein